MEEERIGIELPKIEVLLDRPYVQPGETAEVKWEVLGADSIRLWISTLEPRWDGPLDWRKIADLGDEAASRDRLTISPTETTALYLVARNDFALVGEKAVIEVERGGRERQTPSQWCSPGISGRMQELPHIVPASTVYSREASHPIMIVANAQDITPLAKSAFGFPVFLAGPIPPPPPSISLSASSSVILEDESATVAWSASKDTNWVTTGYSLAASLLLADLSEISGVKQDGAVWGLGGSPGTTNLADQVTLNGKAALHSPKVHGGAVTWSVTASNALGGKVDQHKDIDIVGKPAFSGSCTQSRVAEIRNAVKDICGKLRGGYIESNVKLNSTVDVFKNNYISKGDLVRRLLVALHNLNLITFSCHDFAKDADNFGGRWDQQTNEIQLGWSPGYLPYLEYVILHELIHKCGFNSTLKAYGYSDDEIEFQNHRICCSVYPNCGMCSHPQVKGQF